MSEKENSKTLPTSEQVERFKMLSPMVDSVLGELRQLYKNKQDEILNKLKVDTINRLLKQVKELLSSEPTIEFLDLLCEENPPSSSDALLTLTHYRSALNQFRNKYYRLDGYDFRWFTKDSP